jgi:anti-anti-sigma regulatory factor
MLRILRTEVVDSQVTLILQGHIAAESTDLLEQECLAASRAGARVALDLSGVAFIGRSGFQALMRLSRAGIAIVACTPLIAGTLEQEGIALNQTSNEHHDA